MAEVIEITRENLDHRNEEKWRYKAPPGLNEDLIREISRSKNEPEWMLEKRLKALNYFLEKPVPTWGPDLKGLDMDKIVYYARPDAQESHSWEDVPEDIRNTFEKLGIPEAEREALAGAGAQYESDVVYHNLKKEWAKKGVIFENMDVALQKYPDLVKKYFMTRCVPINDHKYAALHGAVWSGGTFIYVPKDVKVTIPLQAYFRMNAPGLGQFEHTLIVAEEGAEIHYIEGCSAPQYNVSNIHAGCVEIYVHKDARVRYSSIENWSRNTYNLNTKRAMVDENGIIEWINGNMGSCVTMLYPCAILKGKNAKCDAIGIAYAGKGQNQDTGMKVYHLADKTTSQIVSKSISKDGGITTYRGQLKVAKHAKGCKSNVDCDALMVDNISQSNTYPYMEIQSDDVDIGHEAKVGRISDEQIFYLMSRGIEEDEAKKMIVAGFIEPVTKQLPMEYAMELNKLIELEMEGSLG